jgi:hypothetical protein
MSSRKPVVTKLNIFIPLSLQVIYRAPSQIFVCMNSRLFYFLIILNKMILGFCLLINVTNILSFYLKINLHALSHSYFKLF